MIKEALTLYSSDYFLLVYPNPAAAAGATAAAGAAAVRARRLEPAVRAAVAAYWSKRLNCDICYLEAHERFMILEGDIEKYEKPIRILSENGIVGWVWYRHWLNLAKQEINFEEEKVR